MTSRPRITVVGVGPGPLPDGALERAAGAALVVGGRRHLVRVLPGREGSTPAVVELGGDLEPALEAIAGAAGPVVVLASGDPGFFGIVRALAERFGRERLEVLPGVPSVAAAFARAGLPWDDALVVSAHGRDPRPAVNACRAHGKVAVLTAPGFGPAELARALGDRPGRRFVVAERLGEPGERVVEASAAQVAQERWADPNVVLVLDEAAAVGGKGRAWPPRQAPEGWALPEAAFAHRPPATGSAAAPWAGMVTKREVRALALARLGPGVGDLVWDVGAGSGSVGVECARLGAAVVAIDRDPAACRLVRENAARHGVRVDVVEGEAPAALAGLPDPDAAFVGGAGRALGAVAGEAARRARRVVVVALATLERVAPAREALAQAGLEVDAVLVEAARLVPAAGAHRLAPTNPVFLVTGVRA